MMAVRFARALAIAPPPRATIVKFEGSYHGSYDDVELVGRARRSPTAGAARCAGRRSPRPRGLPAPTAASPCCRSTTSATLRDYVDAHHGAICAILVEPMANRIGLIMPDRDVPGRGARAVRPLRDRADLRRGDRVSRRLRRRAGRGRHHARPHHARQDHRRRLRGRRGRRPRATSSTCRRRSAARASPTPARSTATR